MKTNKIKLVYLFVIFFLIISLTYLIYIENKPIDIKTNPLNVKHNSIENKPNKNKPENVQILIKNKPIDVDRVNMFDIYSSRNIGYQNFGENAYVTCYMNSSLQLLRTLFYGLSYKLSSEVKNIFNFINKRNATKVYEILLYIISNDQVRQQFFRNGLPAQSDASEFLLLFIDKIFSENSSLIELLKCTKMQYYVDNNLQPLIDTKKTLNTTHINIQIYDENITYNLTNLIQNGITYYSNVEVYDNNVGKNVNKIELTYYTNFSNYVLFIFDIFTYVTIVDKDNKPIGIISKKLNLNLTLEDEITINTYKFTPISIVCHIGNTITSGHYINYSKRPNTQNGLFDEWWLYNDANVNNIGDIEKLNMSMKERTAIPYIVLCECEKL
jgi:hypothetical protein